MPIKVAIVGAAGKMGRTAVECLAGDAKFEVVATVARTAGGVSVGNLQYESGLEQALDRTKPDVLMELTTAASSKGHALAALQRGIPVVIGSTGLSAQDLEEIRSAAAKAPCLLVPNFAIGALLMMRFAQMAAEWLPDVEIIESHHTQKLDAPSGTAIRTAELINEARKNPGLDRSTPKIKLEGARGADLGGVNIHSVRLPGLLAHQQVIFGGNGEVLTIKHDSMSRTSFETGIKLATEKVSSLTGLVVGLETLLFPPTPTVKVAPVW